MARVEAVVRRRKRAEARVGRRPARDRRGRDPARPVPGLRGRHQRRSHAARVRADPAPGRARRVRSCSARRSTSGSGATRWSTATARSTSSCASCGRSSSASRRAGATSTRTSASATGFAAESLDGPREPVAAAGRRSRTSAAPVAAPRRPRPRASRALTRGYRFGRGPGPQHAHPQLRASCSCWRSPSGSSRAAARRPARSNNILGLLFAGGIVFFGYRMYMEHRTSLFMLEDQVRALLYGSLVLIALALIGDAAAVERGRPRRARLAGADRRRRLRLRHGVPASREY